MEWFSIQHSRRFDWGPIEELLRECAPHTQLFQRVTNFGQNPVVLRVNWQAQSKGSTEWRRRQIEINPDYSRSVKEVAAVLLFELELLTRREALDAAHVKTCDTFEYVFSIEAIEYKALTKHLKRLDRLGRKGIVLSSQTREDYHLGDFIAYLRQQERLGHFHLLDSAWRGSFFPGNVEDSNAKGVVEYWKKRFSWFKEEMLPR